MTSHKANVVSSFIAAFSDTPGVARGVCLKYAMVDRSQRLSYFEAQWFRVLYECVEYFSATHYFGSDMQRAADEAEFSPGLPDRHPIRTMHREKPSLTEGDYTLARRKFCVTVLRVSDLGDSCRIDCSYVGGIHGPKFCPAT
jgi:hypothetical protein